MAEGEPIQQMVWVQLALSMQKNENRPFLVSLYKAQVQVDLWNSIKDPEMSPHIYGNLIFDKEL